MWRHVPTGAHPLDLGYILHARGRWNRPGEYGCLYTALTPEGARAEYEKVVMSRGIPSASGELVSIDVRVEHVLDLTDGGVLATLEVTRAQLTADGDAAYELCRGLADWARSREHSALLVPSAALADTANLVIFPDRPPRHLRLDVGPDRLRLV